MRIGCTPENFVFVCLWEPARGQRQQWLKVPIGPFLLPGSMEDNPISRMARAARNMVFLGRVMVK